mmetsp:Transcript_20216/g.30978  ORF Transcript_20216/g.30978 Transcript_20216/m.30978 type:complete len:119 (+) Transcript_20216:55-411(+)
MLDFFKMKNLTLDIDTADDEEVKNEEEFFKLMAIAINGVGQWALDIKGQEDKSFNSDAAAIQQFKHIFSTVTQRGLALLDTDKPRVTLPLMEYFIRFLKQHQKIQKVEGHQEIVEVVY